MTTLLSARMSNTRFALEQTFADYSDVYETDTVFNSYRELEQHVDYLRNVAEFMNDFRSVAIYDEVLDNVRTITQYVRKVSQTTCTL